MDEATSSKLVKQYFEAVSKIFNCVPGVFQIFLGSFKMFHCLPGVFQIFPDVHHTVSVLTFLAVECTKVIVPLCVPGVFPDLHTVSETVLTFHALLK